MGLVLRDSVPTQICRTLQGYLKWYRGTQIAGLLSSDVGRNRKARSGISQKVLVTTFCTSQFPQKSVNLFFMLVAIKDKLKDLCRN